MYTQSYCTNGGMRSELWTWQTADGVTTGGGVWCVVWWCVLDLHAAVSSQHAEAIRALKSSFFLLFAVSFDVLAE